MLNNNILPLIPSEGSVGASGDLTPLSYIARTISGNCKVLYQNQVCEAKEVYKQLKRKTYVLKPRETLAIMNGTSVMTGLACLVLERARYLAKLACLITSLVSLALDGNPEHFDQDLFKVKPHPGQQLAAGLIEAELHFAHKSISAKTQAADSKHAKRLQDRYSVRCAPHVIGVLFEAIDIFESMLEIEVNSANDNPIIDPKAEKIMHGGHFYGGHVAFAMDSLKNTIANVADLLDRQMALLVDEKFNNGLPPNLSGAGSATQNLNHGFKALQIAVSAWTAEALKLTMPASVFSRSTECHNQDKVSMGTIASRDCIRVLELSEQVVAASLLSSVQALEQRFKIQQVEQEVLSGKLLALVEAVRDISPALKEDRPLEEELRLLLEAITQQKLII